MNEEMEFKLQAWVDGELKGADASRMAQLVEEELDASQTVAELRAVKNMMAGAELSRAVPETREFYWSKIERQIQLEDSRSEASPAKPGLMARWRRFLMPLAGLAAASCVAVFTLTQSTTQPKSTTDDEFTSTDEAMETTTYRDQSSGMTVVWLQDRDAASPTGAKPSPQADDAILMD
jgi:anti-sigma factor RsiW